jgi:HEPN domain
MPRRPPGEPLRPPDNSRKFFRVATQRFAEAQFLFEGERHVASIYIAGYAVECGLKALLLSTMPEHRQKEVAATFRGTGWHNFNRIVEAYIEGGGSRLPVDIVKDLAYLYDEWSVDLRYASAEKSFPEAERFTHSTDRLLEWVKGRL